MYEIYINCMFATRSGPLYRLSEPPPTATIDSTTLPIGVVQQGAKYKAQISIVSGSRTTTKYSAWYGTKEDAALAYTRLVKEHHNRHASSASSSSSSSSTSSSTSTSISSSTNTNNPAKRKQTPTDVKRGTGINKTRPTKKRTDLKSGYRFVYSAGKRWQVRVKHRECHAYGIEVWAKYRLKS